MNRNNRVLQNKCLELNFRETDQLFITLASPQTSFGVSFVTSQVTSQPPKCQNQPQSTSQKMADKALG